MTTTLSYAHGTGETPLLGDTIGANLDRAVAAWPDREALVDVPSGRRWTYARFGADVDELARALLAAGVAKGDRVGIWAVNCPEWVLVQYATARIGAIMVNINPAYRTHEVEYVLQQAGISPAVRLAAATRRSDYRAMVDEVRGRCPRAARGRLHRRPELGRADRAPAPASPRTAWPTASASCPATTRSTSSTPRARRASPRARPSPTTTSSTTATSSGELIAYTRAGPGLRARCPSTTASAW